MATPSASQASDSKAVSVLFVCLGNICRSTMAEGVFRSMMKDPRYAGLIDFVDSCGTSAEHLGDPPDSRTIRTLRNNGIRDYVHEGRQASWPAEMMTWRTADWSKQFDATTDFDDFDYIFTMDERNQRHVKALEDTEESPKRARVMLWGTYNGKRKAEVVVDPYYGESGFPTVYNQCVTFSRNFLEEQLANAEAARASKGE